MICVSLGKTTPGHILKISGAADLVEVRLDLNQFTLGEIKNIFGSSSNLIATFRSGNSDEKMRQKSLQTAIRSGARYVDLDLEEDERLLDDIAKSSSGSQIGLIVSYHNHAFTPGEEELNRLADRLFFAGADIAKIACKVNAYKDNLSLLSLYRKHRNLIAIGMGINGRITRLAACFFGAPFTYASDGNENTADGQIGHLRLKEMIAELKNE